MGKKPLILGILKNRLQIISNKEVIRYNSLLKASTNKGSLVATNKIQAYIRIKEQLNLSTIVITQYGL